MTNGELVKLLENRAVAYRAGAQDSLKRNTHLTESDSTPSQEMIDSVLVDFINYCAACQGMDLAMKRSDLTNQDRVEE